MYNKILVKVKKSFVYTSIFLCSLFSVSVNAQCAMCRAALTSEGNTVKAEAINDGILELSSVQSRIALLSGFSDQFAVAPLFGAFDAELRAGYFAGSYMHSIILSLLTHMGIIGTILIALILYFIRQDGKRTGDRGGPAHSARTHLPSERQGKT